MNVRHWIMIGTTITTLATQTPALQAQDADAKLAAFFKQYLETHFGQQPTTATSLGDHRFDGLLDDISAPARQRWLDFDRETLARLPQGGGLHPIDARRPD